MWGGGPTGGPAGMGNPWAPPPPRPTLQQQQINQPEWSFNPNHYADIPNNEVDWAALAQQWIILKEANTDNSAPIPSGPPPGIHLQHHNHQQQHHQHQHHHMMPNIHQPPPISMGSMNFQPSVTPGMMMEGQGVHPRLQQMGTNSHSHSQAGDIIGEAPMDVETLDNQDAFSTKNPNSQSHSGWNAKQTNWFAPENNNPWSGGVGSITSHVGAVNASGYVPPPHGVPPQIRLTVPNRKKHHQPAGSVAAAFQTFPPYQENPAARGVHHQEYETAAAAYVHKGGYWSTNDNSVEADGTSLSHYSAGTVGMSGYSSDENSMSDFDAAKRKALPAWIREGLEKMEREKRKKEEAEKLEAEREEMRKRRVEEQGQLAEDEQKSVTESKWSSTSRGVSSEEEDEDPVEEKKSDPVKELTLAQLASRLSKEDQEQAIRLAIRRASTLFLCRITDAEIAQAALESLTRAKSKKATSSTMQVRKLGALASLTRGSGTLGLTGYGSDSEEESDASNSDHEEKVEGPDTDEELMAEIERKKRLWDLKRLETESRESSRSRSRSRGPSPHLDEKPEEIHQNNSQLREKREVEKPNVTDATSEAGDTTVESVNGRRVSTDSNSRSTRRDSDAKKDKSSNIISKAERESSSKKCDKSISKSPKKDTKRRSESRDTRRYRSRSSSRHRTKRSRSRSSSRHRRRRSRSRSSNRRRRGTSRNRRRHRSRSESNSRDRHGKSSKKRSKSRDRKRSKSRSNDRSKNSKEIKSEKVKSKSKSESSSKDQDKRSKKRSKSRSGSVSSSESSKRGKSRKKKHKRRARSHSKSRSSSSSRTSTSAKVSNK